MGHVYELEIIQKNVFISSLALFLPRNFSNSFTNYCTKFHMFQCDNQCLCIVSCMLIRKNLSNDVSKVLPFKSVNDTIGGDHIAKKCLEYIFFILFKMFCTLPDFFAVQ